MGRKRKSKPKGTTGKIRVIIGNRYVFVTKKQYERMIDTGSPFGKPREFRRTNRYYIKTKSFVTVKGVRKEVDSLKRIKSSEINKILKSGTDVYYTQPRVFDGLRMFKSGYDRSVIPSRDARKRRKGVFDLVE